MPASRLRPFLELSIDGADRAASIIRRHSCAWQAVSDSQARSSGSNSRPSGVIRRSPRKEKPAQGPVKSIRWCGSNSIMPRSHPWPGFRVAGKSRARGPADGTTVSVASRAPRNICLPDIESVRREYEQVALSTKSESSPEFATNSIPRPTDFTGIIVRRTL